MEHKDILCILSLTSNEQELRNVMQPLKDKGYTIVPLLSYTTAKTLCNMMGGSHDFSHQYMQINEKIILTLVMHNQSINSKQRVIIVALSDCFDDDQNWKEELHDFIQHCNFMRHPIITFETANRFPEAEWKKHNINGDGIITLSEAELIRRLKQDSPTISAEKIQQELEWFRNEYKDGIIA